MPVTTRSKRKHQQTELELELLHAIIRRDMARVRELVELERVSVNCFEEQRGTVVTPLLSAVVTRNLEIARFLLEKRANANAVDASGQSLLLIATVMPRDPAEFTELLLEYGADPDVLHDGYTPLGYAIIGGDIEVVRLFIRHGASTTKVAVNETEPPGVLRGTAGALKVACRFQKLEIITFLLDRGAEENEFMDNLCEACQMDNLEVAKLLLERAGDILEDEIPSSYERPLLCSVCWNGSPQIVRLLLEKISRLAAGSTGLGHYLKSKACLTLALGVRKKPEIAQVLIEYGASVDAEPVLARCANVGYVDGVHFLLSQGANVNRVWAGGETALWLASSKGNVELVKMLLDAEADVTISNEEGETPLGVAYRKGHHDCIYLLLRTSPQVWPRLKVILRAD